MPSSSEPFVTLIVRLAALGVDVGDFDQRLTLVALAAFSAVWVTAVGAAVGSFLNVVVYRLPRGMSLVRPKSRCPACGTPIRAGDNVPIFGWLRLRGRCRTCGSSISSRYPLVEAATAMLFLGLAHFELFSGGANLPGGPEPHDGGLGFVLWHLRPALVGISAYHAVLLCTSLCLSLIAWDGFRPPWRLLAPALLVGVLVPLVLPIARPVLSGLPAEWLFVTAQPLTKVGASLVVAPGTLLDSIIGLAVGGVLGAVVSLGSRDGTRAAADRWGTVAVGGLIGLFLGWQAAVSCGLLAACLSLAGAAASCVLRRTLPITALYAMTVLLEIPLWRDLSRLEWWPSERGWVVLRRIGWPETGFAVTSLIAAMVATGAIAFVAGLLARRDSEP